MPGHRTNRDGYYLLGRDGRHSLDLPSGWQVLANAVLEAKPVDHSVAKMTSQALAEPVGAPPLADSLRPDSKVAIIVDDRTRPTPKQPIIETLLAKLNDLGLQDENIDIVFGLGTHRALSQAEVEETLGAAVAARIRVHSHDAWADDLKPVGQLPHGGELKINRLVAEADYKIAVGSILPHPMNGFGGGAKTLMPGVSNYEFIRDHHLATLIARGTALANTTNNPFRAEINQAAEAAGLNLIINAVYNAQEQVRDIVCGHHEAAHRLGVEQSLAEYAVELNQEADISLVSTFPYDEGPQLIKPLLPGTMITRPGGTVVLFAPKIVGGSIPEPMLAAFDHTFDQLTGDPGRMAVDYLNQRRLVVPQAPMDFNCAIYLTLLYLSRVRVVFVSPDADEAQARRLGFGYAPDLARAIDRLGREKPEAKVNILPSGGLIVPLVEKELVFN